MTDSHCCELHEINDCLARLYIFLADDHNVRVNFQILGNATGNAGIAINGLALYIYANFLNFWIPC